MTRAHPQQPDKTDPIAVPFLPLSNFYMALSHASMTDQMTAGGGDVDGLIKLTHLPLSHTRVCINDAAGIRIGIYLGFQPISLFFWPPVVFVREDRHRRGFVGSTLELHHRNFSYVVRTKKQGIIFFSLNSWARLPWKGRAAVGYISGPLPGSLRQLPTSGGQYVRWLLLYTARFIQICRRGLTFHIRPRLDGARGG